MRICCPCVYVGSVNSIWVARVNQALAVAPCFPSLSGGTKVFPRFIGAVLKEILNFLWSFLTGILVVWTHDLLRVPAG